MTRCSYIPPEGLSVIAIAKERGGTTDGDVQALVDRFGCRAEAAFEMTAEEDSDREQFSCIDHVGHLCGDGYWLVQPIYVPSDAPLTIVNTQGIARAGFGPPIILSQSPTAPPVVDLGTNPTREQVEAAGFSTDNASYREARAAFVPMPLPTPQTVGVARPRGPLNLTTLSPFPPDDLSERFPCRHDDEIGAFVPAPNSASAINATAMDGALGRSTTRGMPSRG